MVVGHMECLHSLEESDGISTHGLLESIFNKNSNLHRYLRQHVVLQLEEGEAQVGEKEQQKDLVMEEPEEKEPQQALVVREQGRQN